MQNAQLQEAKRACITPLSTFNNLANLCNAAADNRTAKPKRRRHKQSTPTLQAQGTALYSAGGKRRKANISKKRDRPTIAANFGNIAHKLPKLAAKFNVQATFQQETPQRTFTANGKPHLSYSTGGKLQFSYDIVWSRTHQTNYTGVQASRSQDQRSSSSSGNKQASTNECKQGISVGCMGEQPITVLTTAGSPDLGEALSRKNALDTSNLSGVTPQPGKRARLISSFDDPDACFSESDMEQDDFDTDLAAYSNTSAKLIQVPGNAGTNGDSFIHVNEGKQDSAGSSADTFAQAPCSTELIFLMEAQAAARKADDFQEVVDESSNPFLAHTGPFGNNLSHIPHVANGEEEGADPWVTWEWLKAHNHSATTAQPKAKPKAKAKKKCKRKFVIPQRR